MTSGIQRRDFLKLAGLLPLSLAAPRWTRGLSSASGQPNVIVLVFDAFSTNNISLYGYARETTPNLARLAKRAIVYHNQYAGSNFTTSGTASLLTGTLPWTNRATEDNGTVVEALQAHNIFNVFQGYYRTAFTHNSWVQTLLNQFHNDIDEIVPRERLYLGSYDSAIHGLFSRDDDIATVGWTRYMKILDGSSYSLFLSRFYEAIHARQVASYAAQFPLGIPINGSKDAFVLEQAVDWLKDHLNAIPRPFFGYFHFLPPHAPYRTSLEFYNRFAHDGLRPLIKPVDVFANNGASSDFLESRTQYDEFILYADKAFGDLFDSMEASGLLDNTWVVVTSDHGEMFERGFVGHGNPTLYQPVIRVPLLIFEPGRKTGMDIHASTSAVDILPTLMQLTGRPIPDWTEGAVLPPFGASDASFNRDLYSVTARKNGENVPLHQASTTLVRGRYKLLYFFGYQALGIDDLVMLFDLQADPEELVDLSSTQQAVTAELLTELKSKIAQANRPYL